jgi:tetratricopeptide (TPR) repeat protein
MDLGRLDSAPHLWRALGLYEECGDLPGQASVHNLLGGFAYWRGEWGQALESYQRARDLARRIGDMVLDAFCAANIGEIALDQGRVTDAEALFGEAFRVWQAAGDRPGTTYAKSSLARIACRTGRVSEALQLFDEAERESDEVGAQLDALEARVRRAEGMLLIGRPRSALALTDEFAHQLGSHDGVSSYTPLIHRIRGAALLRTGDFAGARAALSESLAAGRARQSDYEVALSLELLAELGRRSGDADADRHRREAAEILTRLDVLATPDLLGVASDDEVWGPRPPTFSGTGDRRPAGAPSR